ncbi:MAG: hypothetical protein DDT36_01157 [Firmicutes bacterium]|nr:hypothetical protein [Bacillota bacterium]
MALDGAGGVDIEDAQGGVRDAAGLGRGEAGDGVFDHGQSAVGGGGAGGGGDEHLAAAGGSDDTPHGGHTDGKAVVHGDTGLQFTAGQHLLHGLVLGAFAVGYYLPQGRVYPRANEHDLELGVGAGGLLCAADYLGEAMLAAEQGDADAGGVPNSGCRGKEAGVLLHDERYAVKEIGHAGQEEAALADDHDPLNLAGQHLLAGVADDGDARGNVPLRGGKAGQAMPADKLADVGAL